MLTSDLAVFSRVRLLERSRIEKLLEELRFHETGAVDDQTVIRLGAAAGARILVYGTIDKKRNRIVVRPRLVDVSQRTTTELPEVSGEEADILSLERTLASSAAKALGLEQKSSAGQTDFPTRERLAVLPFYNNSGTARLDMLRSVLADMVVHRLLRHRRCTLVERARIDLVLKEQSLQLTGIVDERTAVRIGKLLGANALFLGAFLESNHSVRLDARIIDLKTGKALFLNSVCVPEEELLSGVDRLLGRPKDDNGLEGGSARGNGSQYVSLRFQALDFDH